MAGISNDGYAGGDARTAAETFNDSAAPADNTRDLSPAEEVYGRLGERELSKEFNDRANEPELPGDAKDSSQDGSSSGSESAQAGSAADSRLPSYADEMYRTTDEAAQERVHDQHDDYSFRM